MAKDKTLAEFVVLTVQLKQCVLVFGVNLTIADIKEAFIRKSFFGRYGANSFFLSDKLF